MAVRANHPDPGRVFVVNGFFVFLIDKILRLMTRDTEFQRVGVFHIGVEATPENNAANAADNQDHA